MKIRSGFVSNSSSSSFVILLPRGFDPEKHMKGFSGFKKIEKETIKKLCSETGTFEDSDFPELREEGFELIELAMVLKKYATHYEEIEMGSDRDNLYCFINGNEVEKKNQKFENEVKKCQNAKPVIFSIIVVLKNIPAINPAIK